MEVSSRSERVGSDKTFNARWSSFAEKETVASFDGVSRRRRSQRSMCFFEDLMKLEFRKEWERLIHLMERARDLLRTGIPSPHGVTPGFVPPPIADAFLWDP